MPYTLCTICGGFGHVNTGNFTRWVERRGQYPVYPYRCGDCRIELTVGDRVEVRATVIRPVPAAENEQGTVEEIWTHPEDGTLYKVRLDSGREALLWRAALRWQKPEATDGRNGTPPV